MAEREFIRDGRAPVPENSITSKIMSANKAKDTKPELSLRKALWKENVRGYRLHLKTVIGRPDISFVGKKVAIFVNGCFWHDCPHCKLRIPRSNTEFWQNKFIRNKERDLRKIEQLNKLEWITLVLWECQIKKNINNCVSIIRQAIHDGK